MADYFELNGPVKIASIKEMIEVGIIVGGVTAEGRRGLAWMVDRATGEVYPPDAKEKLARWEADFWKEEIQRRKELPE